ncbi:MAG: TorF family putative porin [Gammaproteobacteria bacterium]|nr:TorF family putative porin [Gammaproteobacteria bacterium]
MKNWKLIAVFAATLTGAAMPAHAELDLSANFGIMSDYIYRGFHQSDGVANGGIDLATGPFYLGTWIADLDSGNGIEIDVYGGLAFEFENGFSMYVGYTAYRYTEDDDGVYTPATEAVYSSAYSKSITRDKTGIRRMTSGNSIVDVEGGVYKWAPKDTEGNLITENAPEAPGDNLNAANDGTYVFTDEAFEALDDSTDALTKANYERVTETETVSNRYTPTEYEALDADEKTAYSKMKDSEKIETEATAASCVETGFDKDYDEINIGVGYAKDDFSVSLDYAIGEHENFCGAADNDYDIAMLTLDYKGAYVTFGTYGVSEDDEDKGEPAGDYVEVGYATTVNDIDFAVYLVDSDEDINDETRLGMSVSYGFGL